MQVEFCCLATVYLRKKNYHQVIKFFFKILFSYPTLTPMTRERTLKNLTTVRVIVLHFRIHAKIKEN